MQFDDNPRDNPRDNPPGPPCAAALVAGTVALMTTWADPCPKCPLVLAAQRSLLARKVVSNLFFLKHHPGLSAELQQVMARAHQRWVSIAGAPEHAAPDEGADANADTDADTQSLAERSAPSVIALH